jgi:hypothetical protein
MMSEGDGIGRLKCSGGTMGEVRFDPKIKTNERRGWGRIDGIHCLDGSERREDASEVHL